MVDNANGDIIIYQTDDGLTKIDVKIQNSTGEKVLISSGSVSHNQAIEKAKTEYKKYQVKTISPVEKEYLESLKKLNNIINEKIN